MLEVFRSFISGIPFIPQSDAPLVTLRSISFNWNSRQHKMKENPQLIPPKNSSFIEAPPTIRCSLQPRGFSVESAQLWPGPFAVESDGGHLLFSSIGNRFFLIVPTVVARSASGTSQTFGEWHGKAFGRYKLSGEIGLHWVAGDGSTSLGKDYWTEAKRKEAKGTNNASVHWENYISISFHIEWDMIVVTVFLSLLNQTEFHMVQNQKKTVSMIISYSMWKEMEI